MTQSRRRRKGAICCATRTEGVAKESKNIIRTLFLRHFKVVLIVLILSDILFKIKKTIMKKKKMIPENEVIDEKNKIMKKKKKKIKTIKQAKKIKDLFYAKNGHVNNENIVIVKTRMGETKPTVEKKTIVIKDIDTWENLEEGELLIKIKSLNGLINSSQMFSIWSSVHIIMRKKYFHREEKIWSFCEKIAKAYQVSKESKMNIWYKVYYNMKEEIMKTEREEFNKIYPFIDSGECEHDVFIKFLLDELDVWKKKMKVIENKWAHLLFLNLKFERKRSMILLKSL
ncbi:phist protein [Plasmodium cynomolgi strain B]|uniref:Phist protein n=1 Tax=Plasmodium cynomolgi (strain B) TaxID=1120755 RepID=K6UIV3_PLACD|nr:phist protein [Plasmodium cynomolgi strain B]GAB65373.1 phist protein [Plasmodium cynomolgi strain B]